MDKIFDLDELSSIIRCLGRDHGRRSYVHCHGCFDIMHIGHIKHFQAAKKLGSTLIVTITPDRYVNKGSNRPIFHQDLRAEAVASLECVDYVAINKWPTAVETIRLLRPDIFVKGSEYITNVTLALQQEEVALESVGGKLAFTDEIVYSSTKLFNELSNC